MSILNKCEVERLLELKDVPKSLNLEYDSFEECLDEALASLSKITKGRTICNTVSSLTINRRVSVSTEHVVSYLIEYLTIQTASSMKLQFALNRTMVGEVKGSKKCSILNDNTRPCISDEIEYILQEGSVTLLISIVLFLNKLS